MNGERRGFVVKAKQFTPLGNDAARTSFNAVLHEPGVRAEPQLAEGFSQPFAGLPSQSWKPGSQTNAHLPALMPLVFGSVHEAEVTCKPATAPTTVAQSKEPAV